MQPAKFGRELEGRKVRLFFADGEISDGVIIVVSGHDDCEGCDGFVYDLLRTDRAAKYEGIGVKAGSALWSRFEELEKYEILAE
jgi:hypothetical protein